MTKTGIKESATSNHNVGRRIDQKLTWYDANSGTGDPSALVEVPLDPEDGDAVDEGEDEQEAGVDVQKQERLL